MKKLCCVLLALCLLASLSAAAEEAEWTLYESPYGFSLWYDAQSCLIEEGREDGATVIYPLALYDPLPGRDEMGRAALPKDEKLQAYIRIEQPAPPVDAGWTPPADRAATEKELDIAFPYLSTAMLIEDPQAGPVTVEELFVLLPDSFFAASIAYPQDDPVGWSEELWDILSTLEFAPQPAVFRDDLRLDFFQGGAAGMRFTDVVIDEEAEPVVLLPLRELRDFSLNRIVWDEENFEPLGLEPVYTADTLAPGDHLAIFAYFPDVLPELCARYTDAEGERWSLSLFQSGRDGSLLLIPEETEY